MPIPSNRNSVGAGIMLFYVVGVICAVTGIYLSTISRIDLITGHTSMPYIGVGIPLVVVGVVCVVVTQRTAKRNLTK